MRKIILGALLLMTSSTAIAETFTKRGQIGGQVKWMAKQSATARAMSKVPEGATVIALDVSCARQSETFNYGYHCGWAVVYEFKEASRNSPGG